MASEPSNLRYLFGEPTAPTPTIDVSSVIRRSRARRAPRLLGAGAFAVLTVGALAYGGFAGLAGFGSVTASDAGGAAPMTESDDGAASSMGGETGFMDAKSSVAAADLFRCGEPVVEIPPSELGLVLRATAPGVVDAGAASIDAAVVLRNDGSEQVMTAVSTAPAFALTREGIVVATSAQPSGSTTVDLEAGESYEYGTATVALACDGTTLVPGDYEVLAAIDAEAASGGPVVTSPTRLTIR